MKRVWDYTGDPTEPGWYPVLVCYDPREGFFPRAACWSGEEWSTTDVCAFIDERFSSALEAEQLADYNDPYL
jgi:hypothetical protein